MNRKFIAQTWNLAPCFSNSASTKLWGIWEFHFSFKIIGSNAKRAEQVLITELKIDFFLFETNQKKPDTVFEANACLDSFKVTLGRVAKKINPSRMGSILEQSTSTYISLSSLGCRSQKNKNSMDQRKHVAATTRQTKNIPLLLKLHWSAWRSFPKSQLVQHLPHWPQSKSTHLVPFFWDVESLRDQCVLGPPLFTIYVNDLLSVHVHCKSAWYVDESKLYLYSLSCDMSTATSNLKCGSEKCL